MRAAIERPSTLETSSAQQAKRRTKLHTNLLTGTRSGNLDLILEDSSLRSSAQAMVEKLKGWQSRK